MPRLLPLVLVLALSACSDTPKRATDGATLEQFQRFAGPPVDSFTYLSRYYAWKPVGELHAVLWTTINDAYLLKVLPPCVGLDFARGVRVSSTTHTVTRGVDRLSFEDQTCFISEIRPVNYLAMKQELHTIP